MDEKYLNVAKTFINEELDFKWSEMERQILKKVFTNLKGRVFFIRNVLPANMIAVLLAIYSRLRNKRGLRGVFVDNFLPNLLSVNLPECLDRYQGDPAAFLKGEKITSLARFLEFSDLAKEVTQKFLDNLGDSGYWDSLSQAQKMKGFLSTWLDRYGHNSIARPAALYLCCENISILAAKSLEWSRPGAGYIELSTRYVDMAGKDVYPIAKELAAYGVPEEEVNAVIEESFKQYRTLQGENFSGVLPTFFREQFKEQMTPEQLEAGAIGETCDVLGNFLPAATLTSVGIGLSGETLPETIRHLLLDGTPENFAIVEMIKTEAAKIGADQFLRHLEPTPWQTSTWSYLKNEKIISTMDLPVLGSVEEVLLKAFQNKEYFKNCLTWNDIKNELGKLPRGNFDKLPREFELINASFYSQMSFRSWRDLQRMGFSTHRRSYLNPDNGLYRYDKPAPDELETAVAILENCNKKLYELMTKANVPEELKQYPLALGNMINFLISSNLRQWEFCNWQRSKPSVNHEVRQVFLTAENILRESLPWWNDLSRANITPAYIFARGDSDLPLKLN